MGLLRLFLALSVVLHHVPGRHRGGVHAGVAVILFFIMSGYYMALVLNQRYAANGPFFRARAMRLLPGYLAMLLIMLAWFAINGTPHVLNARVGLPPGEQLLLVIMNVVVFGQDLFQVFVDAVRANEHNDVVDAVTGLFSPDFFDASWMLIGQAWSLSSEFLFYLCAPFVVRSVPRVMAVLLASLALRLGLVVGLGYRSANWGYHFFPATLCLFLLGSLSYHLGKALKPRLPLKPLGIGFLALFLGYSLYSIIDLGGIFYAANYDEADLWLVYLIFAVSLPCIFELTCSWRVDRGLGELSYPVYLSHSLIIGIVYFVIGMPRGEPTGIAVVIAASAALAATIHLVVERPLAHLARAPDNRPFRRGVTAFAGVAMLVGIVHIGVIGSRPDGAVYRPPQLVEVVGHYNVVAFRGHYYGIPHGLPVDWSRDEVESLPGVVVDSDRQVLVDRLPQP